MVTQPLTAGGTVREGSSISTGSKRQIEEWRNATSQVARENSGTGARTVCPGRWSGRPLSHEIEPLTRRRPPEVKTAAGARAGGGTKAPATGLISGAGSHGAAARGRPAGSVCVGAVAIKQALGTAPGTGRAKPAPMKPPELTRRLWTAGGAAAGAPESAWAGQVRHRNVSRAGEALGSAASPTRNLVSACTGGGCGDDAHAGSGRAIRLPGGVGAAAPGVFNPAGDDRQAGSSGGTVVETPGVVAATGARPVGAHRAVESSRSDVDCGSPAGKAGFLEGRCGSRETVIAA